MIITREPMPGSVSVFSRGRDLITNQSVQVPALLTLTLVPLGEYIHLPAYRLCPP